jgi:MFS family permease
MTRVNHASRFLVKSKIKNYMGTICVFPRQSDSLSTTYAKFAGQLPFSVSAPSLVPSLVSKEQLATANARIELARTVAYAGGPALGGMLVGSTGAGFAFALATALSILAVLLLLNVNEPANSAAPSKHQPLRDAQEGLAFMVDIGPIVGLVAALIMMLTIWLPISALAAVSFFLFGAGPILWVISTATLRQSVTPSDLLGRVTAVNTLAYAARPLGAAIGSLVGWQLGAESCLILAAAGFLLQAALIWLSPAVMLREPRNDPAGAAAIVSW